MTDPVPVPPPVPPARFLDRLTRVNGLYWLVLTTACLILLLCTLRLTGVFNLWHPTLQEAFWKLLPETDKVTGIFTTVLSFVAGVFVPSPTASGQSTSTPGAGDAKQGG